MKTYNVITFSQIAEILSQAALGVSAVCGSRYVISDMIHSLHTFDLGGLKGSLTFPYYIAIREMGTECGSKEKCLQSCKNLGYPLVIAKIEKRETTGFNMAITFTHGWADKDNNYMEQEFNSL